MDHLVSPSHPDSGGAPFSPSTYEAEADRSESSRPAWSTEGIPGQGYIGTHYLREGRKKKEKEFILLVNVSLSHLTKLWRGLYNDSPEVLISLHMKSSRDFRVRDNI